MYAIAKLGHVLLTQPFAGPKFVAVHPGSGREQPLDQLELAHFQADEQDGLLQLADDVLADVQGERRFSHARSGGQDDELGAVEAAGDMASRS